jgi:hypothetical protein
LGGRTTSLELWHADKGVRHLVCRAVYLPHGIDLRLVEDGPSAEG